MGYFDFSLSYKQHDSHLSRPILPRCRVSPYLLLLAQKQWPGKKNFHPPTERCHRPNYNFSCGISVLLRFPNFDLFMRSFCLLFKGKIEEVKEGGGGKDSISFEAV